MESHPSTWVLVLACLLGLAACNRPATTATPVLLQAKSTHAETDSSVADALITSQVKSALVAAEDIDGENILVKTREGQVTLSGRVPARQIALAEEVARNVDGVRDVNNKLKPIGVMA